jgi:transcriptional regulator with XRE-family HTH domain
MEHALALTRDQIVPFPLEASTNWAQRWNSTQHRWFMPSTGTNWGFGFLGYPDGYRMPTGSIVTVEITPSPRLNLQTSLDDAFVAVATHVEHVSVWASEIRTIRDAFGLTLSALSNVLGVSRPAMYGWLSGSTVPKRNKQARISSLSEIAALWKASGLGSMQKYWDVPESAESAQLRRLLTGPVLPGAPLRELISRLSKSTRLLPPRRSRPTPSADAKREQLRYRDSDLVRQADFEAD